MSVAPTGASAVKPITEMIAATVQTPASATARGGGRTPLLPSGHKAGMPLEGTAKAKHPQQIDFLRASDGMLTTPAVGSPSSMPEAEQGAPIRRAISSSAGLPAGPADYADGTGAAGIARCSDSGSNSRSSCKPLLSQRHSAESRPSLVFFSNALVSRWSALGVAKATAFHQHQNDRSSQSFLDSPRHARSLHASPTRSPRQ